MSYGFENTISNAKEIETILRSRKKPFIEKTLSASTLELARKKAELEEKDGWKILRENKASIRMSLEKPFDEKLEDETWCILARMGFEELSKGRDFKLEATPSNFRQIDVFAKDDEIAFFLECTACEIRKKKSLATLIEKILSFRKDIFDNCAKHYGHSSKLKMKFGIVTRNIDWYLADEKKCAEENIFILKHNNIEYYKKLLQHIKKAAKYQFLANAFRGETIKNLDIKVPATRGRKGKTTFYTFLIKPHELLKIAYISHWKGDSVDEFDTYQRMLGSARLKKIGKYIDDGGHFPTNIVVNIKSKRGVKFEKFQNIGNSAYGQLYLPPYYASAWIIDGQHRLYGFAHSKNFENVENDRTVFTVLAYVNLPSEKESQMFVDINCEQVRVSRNLLNEIYSGLKWDSPIFKERINGLCSRITINLNKLSTSPVYERIITINSKKTNYRCLTLNSFVDGLKENKFFGEEKKSGITPGHLTASYSSNLRDTLEKAVSLIEFYLSIFSDELNEHWNLGDAPGGFVCTNNGLRALFGVLKEILDHIAYDKGLSLDTLHAEDIFDDIKRLTNPLIVSFKSFSDEDYKLFRSRQALKGVKQNVMQMLTLIHKEYKVFHPNKLSEYLERVDEIGTDEARKLIDEISINMFHFVIHKLKKEYVGDSNWWYDGIPENVRTQCRERQEKDKGLKAPEQYLNLIDYHTIANKQWKLFSPYFSMTKSGNKERKLDWLKKLSKVRNITHHREKWPAEKSQVNFVRQVHSHVMANFIL